jgi:glycosyltransferase involved in cell wall biosynthesis
VRVLRVFHSAVVTEFRERERLLRERHGWDVHVACPPEWTEGGRLVRAEPDACVPVHVVPIRGRRDHPILFRYALRELRALVRELRPQVVDVHEEPYSLAAWSVLRALPPDIPVCVYTAQNIHKRYPPPFRRLERGALRRAAAAYPCSTEAGEVLRRKGFRGRLNVLPLGVTVKNDVDVHRHRFCRPGPQGGCRVGFVGRLVAEKGAALAVEAFTTAAGESDVLELVGAGPEERALRALAARLGLNGRVCFTGAVPQEEALRRIASYDVLVVPSLATRSWKEQFGRVAAQAMAVGTPVLAAASGSLPEVLSGAGDLFREADRDDLAEKLARLLRDPGRRAILSTLGRLRAVDELSWERVAAGFDRMYREVLGA